jgi:hypothetical protein
MMTTIYEYIDDGFDRNLMVYDHDAPPGALTLRLLTLMTTHGRRYNIKIDSFILPDIARAEMLGIMQDKAILFGPPFNFNEENIDKFSVMGRNLVFDKGLDDKDSKYLAYFLEYKKGILGYCDELLVLGVNKIGQCLLGSC